MADDKVFLDGPSADTDGETRRKRIADLITNVTDEVSWVETALDMNDARGIDRHLDEIDGWVKAIRDEIAPALKPAGA